WVAAVSFRFYEEARLAGTLSDLYGELVASYLMMAAVWIVVGGIIVGLVAMGFLHATVAAVMWLVLFGLAEPIVGMYQNIRMAGRRIRDVAVVLLADTVLRGVFGVCGALISKDRVAGVVAGQFAATGLVAAVLIVRARTRMPTWNRRLE